MVKYKYSKEVTLIPVEVYKDLHTSNHFNNGNVGDTIKAIDYCSGESIDVKILAFRPPVTGELFVSSVEGAIKRATDCFEIENPRLIVERARELETIVLQEWIPERGELIPAGTFYRHDGKLTDVTMAFYHYPERYSFPFQYFKVKE